MRATRWAAVMAVLVIAAAGCGGSSNNTKGAKTSTGTVTVWKCVTGLREWLGINAKAEKEPMSLAALREFATTQDTCDRR